MPKNKPLPTSAPDSIEQAWAKQDELALTSAVIQKYARVLDMTDSGRDIKPLASGLFEAVDRYNALEASQGVESETPLADILAEAEATYDDVMQIIVYLRDSADYEMVKGMFDQKFPHIPTVFTLAPVCRPTWLIEMECIAVKKANNDFRDF